MKHKDDGYEQMMRVEDPYSYAGGEDADLDSARLAEAEFGALGTGSVADVNRRHEEPLN